MAAAAVLLAGCFSKPAQDTEAAEEAEPGKVFGMWFSYIEYRDYCAGMSEEEFAAYVEKAAADMADLGINTVYVHAIAFTDAFYDSDIYPRSSILGDAAYDPLKIWVEKAHAKNMHIEAWINPMRSVSVSEAEYLPDSFVIRQWIRQNDERVRQVEGRYYLNPAYPETRDLIVSAVEEILNKYDVDGIHMDDYFYPYGTDRRFDAYIYGKAQEENAELTLKEFRTENVNQLVAQLYKAVKAKNSRLLYGISPAGNMENNLEQLYADPYAWAQQGTVDYIEPQIYWGYEHPVKPYTETLREWMKVTEGTKVRMIPGLAGYKVGLPDYYAAGTASQEWVENSDLLGRQIRTSLDEGADGAVIFSYSSLFHPTEDTRKNVENEIIHIKDVLSSE